MKRKVRVLSMLLAIVMVVGLLPLSIWAEDTKAMHTVQFKLNYNGAPTIATQTVADGECATQPDGVVRTGWNFQYWYIRTTDGNVKFDLATPVTEDLVLYARWDENVNYWGPIWDSSLRNTVDTPEEPDEEEPGEDDGVYTVTFDMNGVAVENAPESEEVTTGDTATMPEDPSTTDYLFLGWSTTANGSDIFDFTTSIYKDTTVYAQWFDIADTTDTDGDGLSDYVEIVVMGGILDSTKADTDGNGISDADEDTDGDGISNIDEIKTHGTNPAMEDTDMDGLSDYEELTIYDTDPLMWDTDGDGVSDGYEILLGTDPLDKEISFDVAVSSDDTTASVRIEDLDGEQVESLTVTPYANTVLFPTDMPGYMMPAYDFHIYGSFSKAIISFTFDPDTLGKDAAPTIYYFNEETQSLEELDTTVEGNVASATVTHFSTYILINRTIFEASKTWEDVWDISESYENLEIVFVIDDSGSMSWNDGSNKRLTVASTLIDKLPAKSKMGIVSFASYTTLLTTELTTDATSAKQYLTTTYFKSSGGTYMYRAINSSFNLFNENSEKTLQMMVVLSDGESSDTSPHDSVIASAKEKGIRIYTVGLGSASSTYFTSYLKPLAENTNGKFYYASDASLLADIYTDIGKQIDITTDSDNDGIPDYYEDNMVAFNGVKYALDKNNPDTDGDGKLDGEEIVLTYNYNTDKTRVWVTGKIISDPCKAESTSSPNATVDAIIKRLETTSNKKIANKRETIVEMAKTLLNEGYETSFTAGILANILSEGSAGKFESSAYKESKKPKYLQYMDNNYSYKTKYSGKLIYKGIDLDELYNLMCTLQSKNWKEGKFGLGCVQWTGGRTMKLVKIYREVAKGSSTINKKQTLRAEALMISRELKSSSYKGIYNSWKKNSSDVNSAEAAYLAGYKICYSYEVPANYKEKSVTRGNLAKTVYNIMIGQ